MNNSGKKWEEQGSKFLENQGFKIIDKNFTCRMGEIDIIAVKDEVIHFIEVKFRKKGSISNAAESVTVSKQKRIKSAAGFFLIKNQKYMDFYQQFDVFAIDGDRFEYIENCFY
jgi:putative endonuclease